MKEPYLAVNTEAGIEASLALLRQDQPNHRRGRRQPIGRCERRQLNAVPQDMTQSLQPRRKGDWVCAISAHR